jgi:hypothetical protein
VIIRKRWSRRAAPRRRSLIRTESMEIAVRETRTIRYEELQENRPRSDVRQVCETRRVGPCYFPKRHETEMLERPSSMATSNQDRIRRKSFHLLAIRRRIPEARTENRARHISRPLRSCSKSDPSSVVLGDDSLIPVLWRSILGKPVPGKRKNRLEAERRPATTRRQVPEIYLQKPILSPLLS